MAGIEISRQMRVSRVPRPLGWICNLHRYSLIGTSGGLEEGNCRWRQGRRGRRVAQRTRAEGHGPGRLGKQRIDRVDVHGEHLEKEVEPPGRPRGCPTARGRALPAAHHDLGSAPPKIGTSLEPECVVTEPVGGLLLQNGHLPVTASTCYRYLRSCNQKGNNSVVRGITFYS